VAGGTTQSIFIHITLSNIQKVTKVVYIEDKTGIKTYNAHEIKKKKKKQVKSECKCHNVIVLLGIKSQFE